MADELELRISRMRGRMSDAELDVIVLTDPKNVEYFTGYRSLHPVQKTRPVMAVLTHEHAIIIGSLSTVKFIEDLPAHISAVAYAGYLAEAIIAVDNHISAMPNAERKHVAIDYGQDMLGYGSLELVDRLKSLSSDQSVSSASDVLWRVRMIKTPFEARMKSTGFAIVNRAFDQTIANAYAGISEIELYRMLQAQIFLNGAESSDSIPMLFSDGDFSYSRWPSARKLREGHYIWTDFSATYGGYPTDRNRTARCGEPSAWEINTYTRVRSLTVELARSFKPGLRCRDVYSHFQRLWKEAALGDTYGLVSRIGHGGGLDILEPPSISATDETIIEAGMVFHVEPKLEKNGAVFQFEEILFVQDDGIEFLSELSPEQIPIVDPAVR
ncbi:M24 family metallopeptidase [Mesorhizobium sp.]|uniref:M24 family metallopeptidase n=1 Tax=Mesorhizobium sp. TaxID=1871066 RepID=UPI00257AD769|nr:M24 family metallopeptidase [Mesorhizobium sp.]